MAIRKIDIEVAKIIANYCEDDEVTYFTTYQCSWLDGGSLSSTFHVRYIRPQRLKSIKSLRLVCLDFYDACSIYYVVKTINVSFGVKYFKALRYYNNTLLWNYLKNDIAKREVQLTLNRVFKCEFHDIFMCILNVKPTIIFSTKKMKINN